MKNYESSSDEHRESKQEMNKNRESIKAADSAKRKNAKMGKGAHSDATKKTPIEKKATDRKSGEPRLDKNQEDPEKVWNSANPKDKVDFGREFGQFAHERRGVEIRRQETLKGWVEGKDYAIEYTLHHPDGNDVHYDYVDFKNHRIIDYKAQPSKESNEKLAKTYEKQRTRHIEAYQARFGVTPTYEYLPYPSTKDMYKDK